MKLCKQSNRKSYIENVEHKKYIYKYLYCESVGNVEREKSCIGFFFSFKVKSSGHDHGVDLKPVVNLLREGDLGLRTGAFPPVIPNFPVIRRF